MIARDIFRLDLPLHEEMRLVSWCFGPEDGSPRVGILAGIHGDEWNGPYVASHLGRRLREVERTGRLRGRITIVPAGNPLGINLGRRFWPFDDVDVNRLFPGYAEGETAQRIAAAIFEVLSESDYCLDIHTADDQMKEIPQVRIFEGSHAFVDLARSFGFNLIWRRATTSPLVRTNFSYQVERLGVPTFVVVFGSARRLNRFQAEHVLEGIWSFLRMAEVLAPNDEAPVRPTAEPWVRDEDGVREVVAERAGFFAIGSDLGSMVREGDTIGTLFDPLALAEEPAPIRAPCDGRLITIRVSPLSYEGSPLARIARAEDDGRCLRQGGRR